uniref:Sushi domain-containing protein n=1 Tax=Pygocentrus nattereri TaxID=42514 RepID=A0AAR2LYM4_PYGNA
MRAPLGVIFKFMLNFLTEIRCKQPAILHGTIKDAKEEYKENEQLKYYCEKKYRPRHGIPTCLRNGWSITPECEEINCLLGPPTRGTSTSPTGKNVFRAGESVEVTCSKTHWLFGTKQTKQSILCKESGEWERLTGIYYSCDADYKTFEYTWWGETSCSPDALDYTPQCIRENECGRIPNIPHGKLAYDQYREGNSVIVYCDFGYKTNISSITCKNGQWKPPKCERDHYSAPPQVENAVITEYTQQEHQIVVSFQCREHFELKGKQTIYYIRKNWDKTPTCKCETIIVVCLLEVMCPVPTIENAKTLKKPGTHIEYECLHGYEPDRFTITCNEQGDWDNMPKTLYCGPPPSIEHAVQDFKEQYKDGETATYVCPSNYIKDGDPYMICSRGRWIGKGKCLRKYRSTVSLFLLHSVCTLSVLLCDNIRCKKRYTNKFYLIRFDE